MHYGLWTIVGGCICAGLFVAVDGLIVPIVCLSYEFEEVDDDEDEEEKNRLVHCVVDVM